LINFRFRYAYEFARANPAHMMLEQYDCVDKMATYTDIVYYLAMFGLLAMVVDRQFVPIYGSTSLISFGIRGAVTVTSFAACYYLYHFHAIYHQLDCIQRPYLKDNFMWAEERISTFITECCILLIHEPPFLDLRMPTSIADVESFVFINSFVGSTLVKPYSPHLFISNIWFIAMFARLYLIGRVQFAQTYPIGPKVFCTWANFNLDVFFWFRVKMDGDAFTMVGWGVMLVVRRVGFFSRVFASD
jgi:hypothetical protein